MFFSVEVGFRYGGSLSPLLLINALDYLMRKVEKAGNEMDGVASVGEDCET